MELSQGQQLQVPKPANSQQTAIDSTSVMIPGQSFQQPPSQQQPAKSKLVEEEVQNSNKQSEQKKDWINSPLLSIQQQVQKVNNVCVIFLKFSFFKNIK